MRTILRSVEFRAITVVLSLVAASTVLAVETKNDAPEDHLLKLVGESLKKVRETYPPYFSKTPTEKLYGGAMNGMLRAIDPSGNSLVYKKDLKATDKTLSPQIQVRLVEGVPTISTVVVHSDAFLHDIRQGDLLIRIDDKLVGGKDLATIESILTGPGNSLIKVGVLRPRDNSYHEVSLKRETVGAQVYSRTILNKVGYIQINLVDEKSVALFDTKLKTLTKDKLMGLIVDLRNTAGGTVEDAAKLADPFLSDKERSVAKVEDSKGSRTVSGNPKAASLKVPVVVLVNSGTQGAAEVMAGALQDDHRAVLMGETTLGAGIYDAEKNLELDHVARIATAYVSTPGGHEIMGHGIKPDIGEPGESLPASKVVKMREEFINFVKGITPKDKDDKKDSAASTGTTTGTSASASAAPSGPTTGTSVDEDEDDDNAKTPTKTEKAPADQLLEEYPLVKRYDTVLLRSINLLISTNIFFEHLLQQ